MEVVVASGAAVALLGIALLVWCMLKASRIRKAGSDGPEIEAELRRLILFNMAGVGLGFLGLAIVLAGLLLG